MKKLLLALSLAVPMFADSAPKMIFLTQTNTPACGILGIGCLPADQRQAGILASAHSDDPNVIGFIFTITATKEGKTVTQEMWVKKWTSQYYTSALAWFGSEPSDFSNPQVSVIAVVASGPTVTGVNPATEY